MKPLNALGLAAALTWAAAATTSPLRAAEPATPLEDLRRDATVRAIEKAAPSVVNIATKTRGQIVHRRVLDFWRGVIEIPQQLPPRQAAGSGVIVDEEGYVLTNVHVVLDGDKPADEIWVKLWDDSPAIRARALIGIPGTDVALLKLEGAPGQKFTPIRMAADDDLLLGETVLALGNPLGLGSSVSRGILSAKPRRSASEKDYLEIPDWLQIDASINPGNSGGPLINLDGQMIGLNVAISDQGQGIGFAIPVTQVSSALSEFFTPEAMNQLWLGLRLRPDGEQTLSVSAVHPGSPAEMAGIRPGDTLRRINGREPRNRFDAYSLMLDDKERVRLETVRAGEAREAEVGFKTLGQLLRERTGMRLRELDDGLARQLGMNPGSGLLIDAVDRGTAAAAAGLQPGMVLGAVRLPKPASRPMRTPDLLSAASLFWGGQAGDVFQLEVFARVRGWDRATTVLLRLTGPEKAA